MGSEKQTTAVVAMACLAATVSVLAVTALYWRSRQRQRQEQEEEASAAAARMSLCFSELESKPQNSFKRVLADNSYTPFKHLKREGKEKEISLKLHPYEEEITFLLEQPPNLPNFVINQEHSVMEASYVWVCTQHQLESLAELLNTEQVFAVDTEQHSFRSFLGFTALMQISTQKIDFLLDTIALHDMMDILRPVFSNPSICKVFHGSDNDILWLQRDFHIYVVNLFDTAKACQVLAKPQKSLAYLLETYCRVSTNKAHQREDWRVRPLSSDMVQYACTDAHYLLYIADCLVSELQIQSHVVDGNLASTVSIILPTKIWKQFRKMIFSPHF